MTWQNTTDQAFNGNDFTREIFPKGEYDTCHFLGCDFSGADLGGVQFMECTFMNCNLSLAKLTNTAFRSVQFKDCKMLGLSFGQCSEFGLSLKVEGCNLSHSSFGQARLKHAIFRNSQLHEVDFTGC